MVIFLCWCLTVLSERQLEKQSSWMQEEHAGSSIDSKRLQWKNVKEGRTVWHLDTSDKLTSFSISHPLKKPNPILSISLGISTLSNLSQFSKTISLKHPQTYSNTTSLNPLQFPKAISPKLYFPLGNTILFNPKQNLKLSSSINKNCFPSFNLSLLIQYNL
jgi:hypothetical protein